ncbi:MAG: class I SAM-dependent methyltransferase [Leeuwenhoekiella sp.]
MNKRLLLPEVQEYLNKHEHTELSRFILSGSPFEHITAQELAQQLEGRQKAKQKLPKWYNTPNIFYPPKLNLEQTSSELTAAYKASLIHGGKMADLTGGLGIDTYFFANKAIEVDYFEINTDLASIASHNFKELGTKNIRVHNQNGIIFLKEHARTYDTLYIDPSRRDDYQKKVFLLGDCEPNVPENEELLLEKAKVVMVKTSPLLDIQAALRELSHVNAIHIVAVKNEVKELIFILKNGQVKEEITLFTANIQTSKIDNTYTNYNSALAAEATYSLPKKYLYEPNAALMKSGLFNWICSNYKVEKLHPNSHLYTSNENIDFPGRKFTIQDILPYSKKNATTLLKGQKANITTRNFKENVAQLRARFKIKNGGEDYIFFTTCLDNQQYIVKCSKAKEDQTWQNCQ